MNKYTVLITRYYSETATLKIEAENENAALDEAYSTDEDELDFGSDGDCCSDNDYYVYDD